MGLIGNDHCVASRTESWTDKYCKLESKAWEETAYGWERALLPGSRGNTEHPLVVSSGKWAGMMGAAIGVCQETNGLCVQNFPCATLATLMIAAWCKAYRYCSGEWVACYIWKFHVGAKCNSKDGLWRLVVADELSTIQRGRDVRRCKMNCIPWVAWCIVVVVKAITKSETRGSWQQRAWWWRKRGWQSFWPSLKVAHNIYPKKSLGFIQYTHPEGEFLDETMGEEP